MSKHLPDGYCQECGQYDPTTEAICDKCLPLVRKQEAEDHQFDD